MRTAAPGPARWGERSANSGMLTKLVLHGGIRANRKARQLRRHVASLSSVATESDGRACVIKTFYIIPAALDLPELIASATRLISRDHYPITARVNVPMIPYASRPRIVDFIFGVAGRWIRSICGYQERVTWWICLSLTSILFRQKSWTGISLLSGFPGVESHSEQMRRAFSLEMAGKMVDTWDRESDCSAQAWILALHEWMFQLIRSVTVDCNEFRNDFNALLNAVWNIVSDNERTCGKWWEISCFIGIDSCVLNCMKKRVFKSFWKLMYIRFILSNCRVRILCHSGRRIYSTWVTNHLNSGMIR